MTFGIVELYCGASGKKGFYNNQEIGLARAMHRLGYECVIFYPSVECTEILEEALEEGIRMVYVPAKSVGNHGRYDWKILKRYKIDVAQIGSDNQIFAPSLAKYCRRNNICYYHFLGTVRSDDAHGIKKQIMRMLFLRNRRMLRKDKCFVKTPSVQKQLETMGIKGSEIAPVGLDLSIISEPDKTRDRMYEELGIRGDKKVLLFVGRMDSYKRPLEAVKLLKELSLEYELIMIGTGLMNEELAEVIEKSGCTDRIHWLTKVPNMEMKNYYALAEYLVNFNENEIFGMTILEAMYQGVTVLAVHAPGPDYIIENESSGYLVTSTADMKAIIEGNKKCDLQKVKNRILGKFMWDSTASLFAEWIENR